MLNQQSIDWATETTFICFTNKIRDFLVSERGGPLNIKMLSYQYKDSHYKDGRYDDRLNERRYDDRYNETPIPG